MIDQRIMSMFRRGMNTHEIAKALKEHEFFIERVLNQQMDLRFRIKNETKRENNERGN